MLLKVKLCQLHLFAYPFVGEGLAPPDDAQHHNGRKAIRYTVSIALLGNGILRMPGRVKTLPYES